jgi:hypothetical protein
MQIVSTVLNPPYAGDDIGQPSENAEEIDINSL